MSHVRFGTVQQSFELQTVGVTVRYHVAHLTDDGGENKHSDQVTDDREDIPDEEVIGLGKREKISED